MGTVHIDNLTPGMLLESDVHDRNGRLLLGAGAELTEKNIYVFRTWGIIEADVCGVETPAGNSQEITVNPELWAAREAHVKPHFRYNDLEHPCIKELIRILVLQRGSNDPR